MSAPATSWYNRLAYHCEKNAPWISSEVGEIHELVASSDFSPRRSGTISWLVARGSAMG